MFGQPLQPGRHRNRVLVDAASGAPFGEVAGEVHLDPGLRPASGRDDIRHDLPILVHAAIVPPVAGCCCTEICTTSVLDGTTTRAVARFTPTATWPRAGVGRRLAPQSLHWSPGAAARPGGIGRGWSPGTSTPTSALRS